MPDIPVALGGGALSLQPLLSLKRLKEDYGGLIDDLLSSAGGPVFRAHVGIDAIWVTDPDAAFFVMTAPSELIDRRAHHGFGGVEVEPAICPAHRVALTGRVADGSHGRARAFADAVLAARDEALRAAIADMDVALLAEGPLFAAIQSLVARTLVKGLLDVDVSLATVEGWQEHVIRPSPQGWLSELAAGWLVRCPADAHAAAAELAERADTDWLRELAAAHDVDGDEAVHHVLFMALFNGGGAIRSLFPSILAIAADPDLAGRIRSADPTWMECLLTESLRSFSRPRIFVRQAMRRFELPGGWDVAKGDVLTVSIPSIHRDPRHFPDPDRFDPDRFVRDPGASARVFGFGSRATDPTPFRCAGAVSGVAPSLWTTVVRELFVRFEVSLSAEPEFGLQHFYDAAPADVRIEKMSPRPG